MSDIFSNAIRRPVYWNMGKFRDGRARYARAPFDILMIPSNPTGNFETYMCTYGMAGDVGEAMNNDGDRERHYLDRDGLGWVDEIVYVDDYVCGSWSNDTIFGQYKLGVV